MPAQLRFSKQFLLSSTTVLNSLLDNWAVTTLSSGYLLYTHPNLNVAQVCNEHYQYIAMGDLLDPDQAKACNEEIIQRLADECDSFAALELALSTLSGRWALIATINGRSRVYHDAAGQKSVFYHTSVSGERFMCTHPSLLHSLEIVVKDTELQNEFESFTNSGSWPIYALPYCDVHQLLPNHYLDLEELAAARYWPKGQLQPLTVEAAAKKMAHLVKGATEAAAARNNCILNLTGGYDSRLILASAVDIWEQCEFFTVKRTDSPKHDQSIPIKLKNKYKLKHHFVQSSVKSAATAKQNDELNKQLQINVGGMRYDPSLQATLAVKNTIGDKTHLPGLISEVTRCYYYEDGVHPDRITPEFLAQRSGFGSNPIAIKGCKRWLDNLPDDLSVNILDLFYWEHRLGIWAACGMAFSEAVMDQLSPMNCRAYLEAGLSTDVSYRKSPYALITKTIEVLNPGLLKFKFNYDLADYLQELGVGKLPLPWRIKKAVGLV
ncbi:hypothetical protein WNY77_12225 [Paraglaciecola mesophila]|uniref:Asparagine synthetase domain-containing protein n=1 Tax=Paraglaciecola mesophila TaxID=197222 RepID=A0ABU9SWA0_9ALTE